MASRSKKQFERWVAFRSIGDGVMKRFLRHIVTGVNVWARAHKKCTGGQHSRNLNSSHDKPKIADRMQLIAISCYLALGYSCVRDVEVT